MQMVDQCEFWSKKYQHLDCQKCYYMKGLSPSEIDVKSSSLHAHDF